MRKTKILVTLILLITGGLSAWAQTFSVESFKLLDNDMTANTYGTMEYDQNGDVAALIKIITTQTGFVVDGGMMGIVKTKQEVAEFWVYVPHGIQRIKLRHPQLGQTEYYFPIPIEKARTYEMTLTTGVVRTIVDDQQTMQYLVMNVTPANATVYIDDKLQSVEQDGTVSVLLQYGSHTYRVEAASCMTKAGTVKIGQEKVTLDIELESAQGELTLECPMTDADIFLNNRHVGTGTWTGKVDAGNYLAEVRKDGYRSRSMSITIEEQETKSFTLPVPQPMYGSLQVNSTPKGAQVMVDSIPQGETPVYLTEMLAKNHVVIIHKEGYQDHIDTIKIEENERSTVDVKLSDILTATIKSHPEGATISIDGEPKGVTPYTAEMSSGDYHIVLEYKGYDTFDKTVHISVEKPVLNLRMDRHCLTKSDIYIAPEYQALGFTAFGVAAGLYMNNLNLEAFYDIGGGPGQTVFWSTAATQSNIEKPMEYLYKVTSGMGGKLGYGIRMGSQLRFTPQAGMRILSISGESEGNTPQKTYAAQATFGLRMEYSPFNHFAFVVSPEYFMSVKMGETATLLKDVSADMGKWFSGPALKAGFEIYF